MFIITLTIKGLRPYSGKVFYDLAEPFYTSLTDGTAQLVLNILYSVAGYSENSTSIEDLVANVALNEDAMFRISQENGTFKATISEITHSANWIPFNILDLSLNNSFDALLGELDKLVNVDSSTVVIINADKQLTKATEKRLSKKLTELRTNENLSFIVTCPQAVADLGTTLFL